MTRETDLLRYALSKQLQPGADLQIDTNYGQIPLTEEDAIAVADVLRQRMTDRLQAMEGTDNGDC